jgi:hypothetical protein
LSDNRLKIRTKDKNILMRRFSLLFLLLALVLSSCNDDNNLFDKSADERVADAIANLKSDLIAPTNGWLLKYRPESDAGVYNVLLKFGADNKVNIKTDLAVNDGEFFDQTVYYRIDNSMGIELIFETYSFFSFLFEQERANFGAEFEYIFVNRTPDNALVFVSKSDRGVPSRITLIPATANDVNLLGREVSSNLGRFTSSLRMVYNNKDMAISLTRDNLRRNMTFTYVSKKTDISFGEELDFTTGYLIQADSLVLDTPLAGTFNNQDYAIRSFKLSELSETTINICPEPTTSPAYSGTILNSNEGIVLETSLFDIYGANFHQRSRIFIAPIYYIFDEDGWPAETQILEEIEGAEFMVLLYDAGTRFEQQNLTAIGFLIDNGDNSQGTFALKKFVPTLIENNLRFNFASDFTLYDNQNTTANVNNINKYLDKLTEGGRTYIYRVNRFFYEFYNPCSGWSFYFQAL